MFSGRPSAWLRETANIRPWSTWKIPIPSPQQPRAVEWRDLIILDEFNEFYAVQNLTEDSLSVARNKTALSNVLRAAARVTDVDADGLPDKWELAAYGNIDRGPDALTPSGITNFMAYALAQPPVSLATRAMEPELGFAVLSGNRHLQLRYRRLRGLQGTELMTYTPQLSTNGMFWSESDWTPMSVVNPWDGTGTEIITIRTTQTIDGFPRRFARVSILANP